MELLFQIKTFLFIFSLLGFFKYGVNFLTSTFSNPPKTIEYTDRQLIILASFVSYIITYLIFL